MKKNKVCFIASSGGHLEELMRLNTICNKNESFIITEGKRKNIEEITFPGKKYLICQINRKEILFLIKFIYLIFLAIRILLKEKPKYIITTGALCAYPFCFVGKKFLKIKIIYIESFARCESLSMTGKYMKKISDLYFVQSEELLKFVPNAIYKGELF